MEPSIIIIIIIIIIIYYIINANHNYVISKGKAVPLQACSGPEGSRKLMLPDFMTAQVVSLTNRPLLPTGNTPGTHFC